MFNPVWNKRIEESDRALDPLGMNRVNDRFLNDLLPGITTVTPRARYYSYYVWAVNEAGKKSSTLTQFKKEFYGIDRLFMMCCLAHEQSLGKGRTHLDVNGSDKGRRIWGESDQIIDMDFVFFGNKLGGYGQYYQGAIARLGLTTQGESDIFEHPSEIGKNISISFDEMAKESGFKDLIGKQQVSKKDLQKCSEAVCLCMLKQSKAKDRQHLRQIFIPAKKLSEVAAEFYRQQTLALILYTADVAASHNYTLDSQRFLDACYYGQVGDTKVFPITFKDNFSKAILRWKIFRAHDHIAYASEAVLCQFLAYISQSATGASEEDFLKLLMSTDVFLQFKNHIGSKISADNFNEILLTDILDELSKAENIESFTTNPIEVSRLFDKTVKLDSPFCERNEILFIEKYFKDKIFNPKLTVAPLLTLLALLYERFLWYHETKQEQWIQFLIRNTNLSRGLSPARFIESFDKLITENKTVADLLQWFADAYVIKQAQDIYEDKSFSFNIHYKPKCWFHKEGDRYVKDRDYQPGHRNTRFESSMNILEDLGLIESINSTVQPSTDGKNLLKAIME